MLEKKGIKTVEAAAAMSDKELKEVPLVGRRTVTAIRAAQANLGIPLPGPKQSAVEPAKAAKKTRKRAAKKRVRKVTVKATSAAPHYTIAASDAGEAKLLKRAHAVIRYLRAMDIPDTEIDIRFIGVMATDL
jgi:hypothetical protein